MYEDLGFNEGDYSITLNVPTNLAVGENGTFEVHVYSGVVDITSSCDFVWQFGDSYLTDIPPSPNEKYLFPESRIESACEDTLYPYTQELDPHHGKGGELVSYLWDESGTSTVPYLTPAGAIYGHAHYASMINCRTLQTTDTISSVISDMYVIIENVWQINNIINNKIINLTPIFTHYSSMPINIPTKFYIYDSLTYQTYPTSSTGQRNLLYWGYGRFNGSFIDMSGKNLPSNCSGAYLVIPVAYKISSVNSSNHLIQLSNNICITTSLTGNIWYNVSSGEYAINGGGTLNNSTTFTVTSLNPYWFTATGSSLLAGTPILLYNTNASHYSLISSNTANQINLVAPVTGAVGSNYNYRLLFKQQPIILMKTVELYDNILSALSPLPLQHFLTYYGNNCYFAFDNKEIVQIIDVTDRGGGYYDLTVIRAALFADLYPNQTHPIGSFLYDINFRGTRIASGSTDRNNKTAFMAYNRNFKQNYPFCGYIGYDTP
jgi:hypothetical protein